jgi:hypothetical protein
LTSYPGGPNCGPSAVNPMVLMALKPYRAGDQHGRVAEVFAR